MELRHLKYFLKLAEELSFVRAAEKLFISQPPLSRQIKELETEIGAQLFERNNKRVILTDAGKYYQKEIRELVQNLERINIDHQKNKRKSKWRIPNCLCEFYFFRRYFKFDSIFIEAISFCEF